MTQNKFKDPKAVLNGFGAALVGVAVYCLAIAPLIKDGPYAEVAMDTLMGTGLGIAIVIVVLAVIWLTVLAVQRKK